MVAVVRFRFPRLRVAEESCGKPYVGYFTFLDMLGVTFNT